MYQKRGYLLPFLLIFGLHSGQGQDSLNIEQFLESFQVEVLPQSDMLLQLQELMEQPVDVNRARFQDLMRIPFLDASTALAILAYRERQGRIRDIAELSRIPGISSSYFKLLRPFLRLDSPSTPPRLTYRLQLRKNWPLARGFREQYYAGNPFYVFHKFRYHSGDTWQLRLVWEKDAGEANWFDFGSFSLYYHPRRKNWRFLIGDYNIRLGQGLVLNRAYGSPLYAESAQLFRESIYHWAPKFSVNEWAYLRGGLLEYRTGRTGLLAYYSDLRRDATIGTDTRLIRRIETSGLHRTPGERAKENNLRETLAGGALRLLGRQWHLIFAVTTIHYSLPVMRTWGIPAGRWTYASLAHQLTRSPARWTGETVLLQGKVPAFRQAFLLQQDAFSYGVAVYYSHPQFWAFHGREFGEMSRAPGNRVGFFLQTRWKPTGGTTLAALYHQYQPVRPLQTFRQMRKTLQMQWNYALQQTDFLLRWTVKRMPYPTPRSPILEQRHEWRFQWRARPAAPVTVSQRVEITRWQIRGRFQKGYGISFFQHLSFRPTRGWQLELRWSQFHIPDYSLRQYEYEPDLPDNFRVSLWNGRGYRWFLLLKCQSGARMRWYLKIGERFYPDASTLGSHWEQISDNRIFDLRLQCQLNL